MIENLFRSATSGFTVVGVVSLIYLIYVWRSYSKLRHFDGPRFASVSILWIVSCIRSGCLHSESARVCHRYGSTSRIGPKHLVTTDADLWRRVNARDACWRKSAWYDSMVIDVTADDRNVLSERDIARHERLRAKLGPGYSGKANPGVEKRLDRQVRRLINLIDTKYKSTESIFRPLNFARTAQYFTVDSISDIALGEAFDDLGQDADVLNYISTAEENIPLITQLSAMPVFLRLLRMCMKFQKWLMPSSHDKMGLGPMIRVAREVVAKRFASPEEKEDMLGSFIKKGLSQREAEAETTVQILAGSDTTATAIRSTLLHIITQPSVYRKLRAEVDTAAQDIDGVIPEAEARKLPYLQACIKEGLRITPPVTGLLEKEAAPKGDYIGDKFVPGGTHLGFCVFGAMRDKQVFGEDADMFRPERWLETDDESKNQMGRAVDLVFGSGRNSCLGRPLAMMELNKVFFELLRRYDVSIVNSYAPIRSHNAGLWMQSEMYLRISDRTA